MINWCILVPVKREYVGNAMKPQCCFRIHHDYDDLHILLSSSHSPRFHFSTRKWLQNHLLVLVNHFAATAPTWGAVHVDRMGIIFGTYTRLFEAEEKAVVQANPQDGLITVNSKCKVPELLIAMHRKAGNTSVLREAHSNLEMGRMLDFVNWRGPIGNKNVCSLSEAPTTDKCRTWCSLGLYTHWYQVRRQLNAEWPHRARICSDVFPILEHVRRAYSWARPMIGFYHVSIVLYLSLKVREH